MVSCENCKKEFTKKDTINECELCEKIVCDKCKEAHVSKCVEYEDRETPVCSECGDSDDTMYECSYCSELVCDSCTDSHSEKHIDEIFTDYKYDEYVNEKVAEAL